MSGINRGLVHHSVVLKSEVLQLSIVPECPPLGVHTHAALHPFHQLYGPHLLHVTHITAGAWRWLKRDALSTHTSTYQWRISACVFAHRQSCPLHSCGPHNSRKSWWLLCHSPWQPRPSRSPEGQSWKGTSAQTKIWRFDKRIDALKLTPRLLMASLSKPTTLLPSAPDALKPLVQLIRIPWMGKKGRLLDLRLTEGGGSPCWWFSGDHLLPCQCPRVAQGRRMWNPEEASCASYDGGPKSGTCTLRCSQTATEETDEMWCEDTTLKWAPNMFLCRVSTK